MAETTKDFQIGNKAKDLLIYTFTVTKPSSEKSLESKDVLSTMLKLKTMKPEEVQAFCSEAAERLRRSSIQRMNSRLRYWSKAYPKGEVSKEDIIISFKAWNAHAAHGNTYILRDRYRKRVENIIKEEIRI